MNSLMKTAQILIVLVTIVISKPCLSDINFNQMKEDIETLASDDMQGRKVFTPAIDRAADYIGKRFTEIGLKPMSGQSLKQDFFVYSVSPDKSEIILNNQLVPNENLASLSFYRTKNINTTTNLNLINITEEDNFREVLSKINQSNKDTLVLVNPSHRDMFIRYQTFFARAKHRMKVNQGPSLVLIMTEETSATTVNITLENKIMKQRLTNVVGLLKADSAPSKQTESVIFSAHYDHLGLKNDEHLSHGKQSNGNEESQTLDLIFNGADDDASGTSAVIQLAAYYSKQKNRQRDIIFAAFTAEEIGGFGSQYFSSKISPNDIVAMINIEMIGKVSKFGMGEFWMTGVERSNLDVLLQEELTKHKKNLHADPYPKQQLFYRSDNATLARLGVPAHSFSTVKIDEDTHYHKASDEVETLNLKSMFKVIQNIGLAAKPLVLGTRKPTRLDTKDVRKKGFYF